MGNLLVAVEGFQKNIQCRQRFSLLLLLLLLLL